VREREKKKNSDLCSVGKQRVRSNCTYISNLILWNALKCARFPFCKMVSIIIILLGYGEDVTNRVYFTTESDPVR
jgi:hypothetical protein